MINSTPSIILNLIVVPYRFTQSSCNTVLYSEKKKNNWRFIPDRMNPFHWTYRFWELFQISIHKTRAWGTRNIAGWTSHLVVYKSGYLVDSINQKDTTSTREYQYRLRCSGDICNKIRQHHGRWERAVVWGCCWLGFIPFYIFRSSWVFACCLNHLM